MCCCADCDPDGFCGKKNASLAAEEPQAEEAAPDEEPCIIEQFAVSEALPTGRATVEVPTIEEAEPTEGMNHGAALAAEEPRLAVEEPQAEEVAPEEEPQSSRKRRGAAGRGGRIR